MRKNKTCRILCDQKLRVFFSLDLKGQNQSMALTGLEKPKISHLSLYPFFAKYIYTDFIIIKVL
jgi:hypothetical protein